MTVNVLKQTGNISLDKQKLQNLLLADLNKGFYSGRRKMSPNESLKMQKGIRKIKKVNLT